MNQNQHRIRKKLIMALIVIVVYLMFPFVLTMTVTGVIEDDISDELITGRRIIVKYKNATKSVDINKFIVMVLANRLSQSSQIEVLKAESIMVRTDIYRIMDDQMSVDSTSLGMTFLTEKQMKTLWGNDYESNYNLISDCVSATSGRLINYNGRLIEARYTELSNGNTLSGAEIIGGDYTYLTKVSCPEDVKSPDYLCVSTIAAKDFIKKMKSAYEDIGLSDSNPYQDIQIASKTADGYVLKLQVGNVIMTGSKFAEILGINSPCMQIEELNGSIKITTKGKGDGFGVSIYTANQMAESGKTCDDILTTFYSGITFMSE